MGLSIEACACASPRFGSTGTGSKQSLACSESSIFASRAVFQRDAEHLCFARSRRGSAEIVILHSGGVFLRDAEPFTFALLLLESCSFQPWQDGLGQLLFAIVWRFRAAILSACLALSTHSDCLGCPPAVH